MMLGLVVATSRHSLLLGRTSVSGKLHTHSLLNTHVSLGSANGIAGLYMYKYMINNYLYDFLSHSKSQNGTYQIRKVVLIGVVHGAVVEAHVTRPMAAVLRTRPVVGARLQGRSPCYFSKLFV